MKIEIDIVFDCIIDKDIQLEIYIQHSSEEDIRGQLLHEVHEVKEIILSYINKRFFISFFSLSGIENYQSLQDIKNDLLNFYNVNKKLYGDLV